MGVNANYKPWTAEPKELEMSLTVATPREIMDAVGLSASRLRRGRLGVVLVGRMGMSGLRDR
jgi:hypothetical protein